MNEWMNEFDEKKQYRFRSVSKVKFIYWWWCFEKKISMNLIHLYHPYPKANLDRKKLFFHFLQENKNWLMVTSSLHQHYHGQCWSSSSYHFCCHPIHTYIHTTTMKLMLKCFKWQFIIVRTTILSSFSPIIHESWNPPPSMNFTI